MEKKQKSLSNQKIRKSQSDGEMIFKIGVRDLFELAETGELSLNIGNSWRKWRKE